MKPGRKPGSTRLPNFKDDEILYYKGRILDLLTTGEATTLTGAAGILDIPALRVHHWSSNDKDFGMLVSLAREVIADKLEEDLSTHSNFIPKMMILKGIRPMYRDNYKADVRNEALELLIKRLLDLGSQPQQPQSQPTETVEGEVVNIEEITKS